MKKLEIYYRKHFPNNNIKNEMINNRTRTMIKMILSDMKAVKRLSSNYPDTTILSYMLIDIL